MSSAFLVRSARVRSISAVAAALVSGWLFVTADHVTADTAPIAAGAGDIVQLESVVITAARPQDATAIISAAAATAPAQAGATY